MGKTGRPIGGGGLDGDESVVDQWLDNAGIAKLVRRVSNASVGLFTRVNAAESYAVRAQLLA